MAPSCELDNDTGFHRVMRAVLRIKGIHNQPDDLMVQCNKNPVCPSAELCGSSPQVSSTNRPRVALLQDLSICGLISAMQSRET